MSKPDKQGFSTSSNRFTTLISITNKNERKFIHPLPKCGRKLYRAFTDPAVLTVWLAPGDMTGEVHSFDYRVGGGYQMSLYYPSSEQTFRGKTEDREDRFTARLVELTPPRRIIEAIDLPVLRPL
jgi:uncharacterized protein YndB with AHSA1/START domain